MKPSRCREAFLVHLPALRQFRQDKETWIHPPFKTSTGTEELQPLLEGGRHITIRIGLIRVAGGESRTRSKNRGGIYRLFIARNRPTMETPHQTDQAPSSSEDLKLLLLSDSNLPVGGFVSSSGLESFINHGYLTHCKTDLSKSEAIINFTFSNAQNYANLAGPFFYHLHTLIISSLILDRSRNPKEEEIQRIVKIIGNLNQLYDSMCLSPVNRRNSYAQGAAFLLLYTKAFSPSIVPTSTTSLDRLKTGLIEALKREIRRGNWSIHYPISFAFVTGLLEISLDRAIHLHIFLHIRSILSAAVRLNIIGPYLSQKIMYTKMEWMLEKILQEIRGKRLGRTDLIDSGLLQPDEIIIGRRSDGQNHEQEEDTVENGPRSTWPFGEIIQTRHDSCHVRLFNS
ncbi:hypothetical protein PSTG_06564 [Puccinia striiformis f. sp. tritici PST-78]|uniref:Uncharacterized protein n=1 Tax=Puccinia striiformis f. sp. tritici PST-78 TaxID=1165861 RepID=A0A0L0VLK5_9BASI|nr:hypothetical protein PSTG_06564 [Puccinia striiformis f. sp. tritici PST-78]